MKNSYFLAQKLGEQFQSRGLTLALAESCTGGGLAYVITMVPGSSTWFERGFVTYTNQSKQDLLDVQQSTLDQFGAVSMETAEQMAKGVLNHSTADYSLSITGIAGPGGGSNEKPVGTVCFGLGQKDAVVKSCREIFYSGRHAIRDAAMCFAMEWLLQEINKNPV